MSQKIEFPKFKYHATKPAQLIRSKEEEAALGSEWKNSPTECGAPEALPSPAPVIDESRREIELALARKSKKSSKEMAS